MRRSKSLTPTLEGLEHRALLSGLTQRVIATANTSLVSVLNDSRSTAQNLGSLSGTRTINGSVGGSDPRDYFRFTFGRGRVEITLSGLRQDIDFVLLNSKGSQIGTPAEKGGTSSELKRYSLVGGTYYVKVYPGVRGAISKYKLGLKVLSSDDGGLGLVPTPSPLGQRIVNYLAANRGKRLGGGECAHLATEALRVAGAKFVDIGSDTPGDGDYVWGSLVKVVRFQGGRVVDSAQNSVVLPGDVIQYRDATFSTGSRASHHTSVVAAVDANGRPTKVYEQNLGNNGVKGVNRTVTLRDFDMSKLTGGWLRIYRPQERSSSGRTEFTIVNNVPSAISVQLFGKTYGFTADNTARSFKTFWSSGTPTLVLNGVSYTIQHGAGYQIVGSGSSATLRRLPA